MVLKGFSWRRALANAEEEILKSNEEEERVWHVFTEEIFPCFPAKDLQTLKSVCKNWNRIISSPYFVKLHLNIFNESRIRVLVPQHYGFMIEYNNYNYDTKKILYPPSTRMYTTILGSCDGLLCLHFGGGLCHTIAVYNPSTGKYFRPNSSLKDTTYYAICSWFGHHPCSGEYVLVLGDFYREVGVYKFNNSISNLEKIHSTSCISPQGFDHNWYGERVGTLLHGAVHWPAEWNRRHVIFAYHLDDEKYLEISLPVRYDFGFVLGVAEGCLFAFFKTTDAQQCEYEMWIMKEYGVQQSWIKYANIQGFSYHRILCPLAFFPNGNDLILHPNESRLIKYTFNNNKALLLMDHDYGTYHAIMCADSLVSPEIVGT